MWRGQCGVPSCVVWSVPDRKLEAINREEMRGNMQCCIGGSCSVVFICRRKALGATVNDMEY